MKTARLGSWLVALGALGLVACTARPLPVREYVLTPVTADPTVGAKADGLLIGVGPIDVPGYLRRPEIVTRAPSGRLEAHALERWGEDLAGGFGRTLAVNLARELPGSRIFVAPWRVQEEPDWSVSLQIRRFERDPTDTVTLEAGWLLLPPSCAARKGALGTTTIREPVAEGDMETTVEAHSRAVATLAAEIAAAIRAAPRGAPCSTSSTSGSAGAAHPSRSTATSATTSRSASVTTSPTSPTT